MIIVAAILLVASIVQLLYIFIFYSPVAFRRGIKRPQPASTDAVSVIICARNEAENLERFLPSVLEQDYPDFEVIVVNDCSDDDTEEVLTRMAAKYPNLRITTLFKDASLIHSKKMALFIGIKAARNELLLLTDADCQPVSPDWIKIMAEGFTEGRDFVLGYGGYHTGPGLLNSYIRYDVANIAMQYMGMAMAHMPYKGVGRNLAYRRSVFFDNRGFGPHLSLQSGDDDLFVNRLARRDNCHVALNPDSFTLSAPSGSWDAFRKQKMRHMSTSALYRRTTRLLLFAEPLTRFLFYVSTVILLAGNHLLPIVLSLFGLVFLSRLVITSLAQKALNEGDLLLISPLFDFLSLIINAVLLIGSRTNKRQTYEWK